MIGPTCKAQELPFRRPFNEVPHDDESSLPPVPSKDPSDVRGNKASRLVQRQSAQRTQETRYCCHDCLELHRSLYATSAVFPEDGTTACLSYKSLDNIGVMAKIGLPTQYGVLGVFSFDFPCCLVASCMARVRSRTVALGGSGISSRLSGCDSRR